MTTIFTQGSTVYSVDGRAANYVGLAAWGGHVVEAIYEADDEEPHYADPEVWREVFADPPREKLAGDLAGLQEKIESAKAMLAALSSEKRDIESAMVSVRRHASNNPELAPLALWLSGEAKFAVILGGDFGNQFDVSRMIVGPVPEVFKEKNSDIDRGKIRLVSLYYDMESSHRYSVRIARYTNGSGDKDRRVFLGRTQQEAFDAAAGHVSSQQKIHSQADHIYAAIGAWLSNFGYDALIEPKTRTLMEEANEKGRRNLAKQAADELARAEAALQSAREKHTKTQAALAGEAT
jgi:hypothetical protein